MLDKVIRAYSSNFSMNLNVVSSDNNKISCKISFKENPNCLVFIEIDKNKPQINCKFFFCKKLFHLFHFKCFQLFIQKVLHAQMKLI